jgi:hypothetical protein
MRLEQRIAHLEAKMAGIRDNGDAVLLSPYDACILISERARLDNSPDSTEYGRRIDALLESHKRAIARIRPEPMSPAEATEAVRKASERDNDPERAEKYRQERLAKLLPVGNG